MPAAFIIGAIVLVVVVGVLGYLMARKRREAMGQLAVRLGLGFEPGKNRDLARRYSFLDKLRAGSNRYAFF
jgi:hypothetical protein